MNTSTAWRALMGVCALCAATTTTQAQSSGAPSVATAASAPLKHTLPADRDLSGGKKTDVTGLVAKKNMHPPASTTSGASAPGSTNMPGGIGTGKRQPAQ